MTAKRVTIGAKPTLVQRDTEGAGTDDMPAEASLSTASSIEQWLRQGESGDDRSSPPADEAPQSEGPEMVSTPSSPATEAHAPHAEPAAPGAPTTKPRLPAGGALPPWAGIAGGAVAGAAVAAAIAWLAPQLSVASDPRIVPLTERVAHVEGEVRVVGERVGKIDNEMAQTLDEQSTTTERLAQQAEQIATLTGAVAESAQRTDPAVDISSPLFAVALGQLRTTFYTGRPFEAELVNVYAIAGNNDPFSSYLTELMGPARTGVPNAAELYRVFPSYVAAAGLRVGDTGGYYQYGLSLVNRYVGLATEPHSVEMANLAVTRASAALIAGDVAGAVNALRDLNPHAADLMAPWLDAARSYLRSETAITEMTRIVVDRLRDRAKQMPAGAAGDSLSNPEASAEPSAGGPATLPPAALPANADPAEVPPADPAAAVPQATAP
ncbi:COG4223 family protein [Ancylobacter sp. VNQ12]|uniref:COG4223 family protein n=1 Tax=Ancylobacter sp. VNQ12 TaxID=3400920 RepID=UPI003C0A60A7